MTLLVVELALRLKVCTTAGCLRPLLRDTVQSTKVQRSDPVRHHAFIEGIRYVTTGSPPGFEYCVYGAINAQGMNDSPVPREKEADEKRVVVLGDSFVAGLNVRREQNLCEVLEVDLAKELSGPVQVINAGVVTYSPLLEYVYYKHSLRAYRPDAVVLVFFANDVFDDLRYTQAARVDESGVPTSVAPDWPWLILPRDGLPPNELNARQWRLRAPLSRTRPWLASKSYFAALVHYAWVVWQAKAESSEPPRNDEFFVLEDNPALAPQQKQGWALTRRYITLLKEECDRDGIPFLLTAVPIAAQIYGRTTYDHFFFRGRPTDADHAELAGLGDSLGIDFVDLRPSLKSAGGDLYFPRDGHWTPKGHRVAADTLQPYLLEMLRK